MDEHCWHRANSFSSVTTSLPAYLGFASASVYFLPLSQNLWCLKPTGHSILVLFEVEQCWLQMHLRSASWCSSSSRPTEKLMLADCRMSYEAWHPRWDPEACNRSSATASETNIGPLCPKLSPSWTSMFLVKPKSIPALFLNVFQEHWGNSTGLRVHVAQLLCTSQGFG